MSMNRWRKHGTITLLWMTTGLPVWAQEEPEAGETLQVELSPYDEAIEHLKAGEARDAARILCEVVETDPAHTQAWWELGWARWAMAKEPGSRTLM